MRPSPKDPLLFQDLRSDTGAGLQQIQCMHSITVQPVIFNVGTHCHLVSLALCVWISVLDMVVLVTCYVVSGLRFCCGESGSTPQVHPFHMPHFNVCRTSARGCCASALRQKREKKGYWHVQIVIHPSILLCDPPFCFRHRGHRVPR